MDNGETAVLARPERALGPRGSPYAIVSGLNRYENPSAMPSAFTAICGRVGLAHFPFWQPERARGAD